MPTKITDDSINRLIKKESEKNSLIREMAEDIYLSWLTDNIHIANENGMRTVVQKSIDAAIVFFDELDQHYPVEQ